MSSPVRVVFIKKQSQKVKHFIQTVFEKLKLIFFGILFIATWPILIVFAWVKSIFSEKTSDPEKTEITKEVIGILGLLLVLSLLYYSTEKISPFLNHTFNPIGYWVSDHWYLLVILFVLLAFLEHFKEKK